MLKFKQRVLARKNATLKSKTAKSSVIRNKTNVNISKQWGSKSYLTVFYVSEVIMQ